MPSGPSPLVICEGAWMGAAIRGLLGVICAGISVRLLWVRWRTHRAYQPRSIPLVIATGMLAALALALEALGRCLPHPLLLGGAEFMQLTVAVGLMTLGVHLLRPGRPVPPLPQDVPGTRGREFPFKAAADANLDPVALLHAVRDADGCVVDFTCTYVNDRMVDLLARPRAELVGVPMVAAFPSTRASGLSEAALQALTQNRAIRAEVRVHHPGVTFEWVERQLVPLPDTDSVAVFVRDVTARRRTEDALRQSEENLRNAFDYSGIGMAVADLAGRFVKVNEALCRIVGYSEAELLERTFTAITHPDDAAMDQAATTLVLDGVLGLSQLEKRCVRKDGQPVWVLMSGSVVRDQEGNPLHFVAGFQDIDARKRMEQELGRSEAMHRTLARNFPNGALMLFDTDLRHVLADGAGLGAMGLSQPAVEGRRLQEILPQPVAQQLEEAYRTALEGLPTRTEVELSSRTWEVHTLPVRDELGRVIHGMAMTQDITERRHAEALLHASLKEKEVLLKEVHHRVKNNLQVISSLLSLQSRRLSEGPGRDVFRECQARVQSIALVHERLYRSKDPGHVDALEYLREVVGGVQRAFAAERVACQVGGDALSLGVDAAVPCGLVVNELASNCFKHAFPNSGTGTLKVDIRRHGERYAVLRVQDNGVGLPEDVEARKGRSLGLQLVASLVEQMGGELKPLTGSGAGYQIRFPLAA